MISQKIVYLNIKKSKNIYNKDYILVFNNIYIFSKLSKNIFIFD